MGNNCHLTRASLGKNLQSSYCAATRPSRVAIRRGCASERGPPFPNQSPAPCRAAPPAATTWWRHEASSHFVRANIERIMHSRSHLQFVFGRKRLQHGRVRTTHLLRVDDDETSGQSVHEQIEEVVEERTTDVHLFARPTELFHCVKSQGCRIALRKLALLHWPIWAQVDSRILAATSRFGDDCEKTSTTVASQLRTAASSAVCSSRLKRIHIKINTFMRTDHRGRPIWWSYEQKLSSSGWKRRNCKRESKQCSNCELSRASQNSAQVNSLEPSSNVACNKFGVSSSVDYTQSIEAPTDFKGRSPNSSWLEETSHKSSDQLQWGGNEAKVGQKPPKMQLKGNKRHS